MAPKDQSRRMAPRPGLPTVEYEAVTESLWSGDCGRGALGLRLQRVLRLELGQPVAVIVLGLGVRVERRQRKGSRRGAISARGCPPCTSCCPSTRTGRRLRSEDRDAAWSAFRLDASDAGAAR